MGFDFLGVNIRKYSGKLLIKPSKKNVKACLDKVRNAIKDNKTAKQINLILSLNPLIKGWANYHRTVNAKDTFKHVDNEIWQSLWQWAKRRHPDKSPVWIKKKYFKTTGNRNWVFVVAEDREKLYPDGKPFAISLFRASDIPIKREFPAVVRKARLPETHDITVIATNPHSMEAFRDVYIQYTATPEFLE